MSYDISTILCVSKFMKDVADSWQIHKGVN